MLLMLMKVAKGHILMAILLMKVAGHILMARAKYIPHSKLVWYGHHELLNYVCVRIIRPYFIPICKFKSKFYTCVTSNLYKLCLSGYLTPSVIWIPFWFQENVFWLIVNAKAHHVVVLRSSVINTLEQYRS